MIFSEWHWCALRMVAALQLGWELLKLKMNTRVVIIWIKIMLTCYIKEGGGISSMKNDLQVHQDKHHNLFQGFLLVCKTAFLQNMWGEVVSLWTLNWFCWIVHWPLQHRLLNEIGAPEKEKLIVEIFVTNTDRQKGVNSGCVESLIW